MKLKKIFTFFGIALLTIGCGEKHQISPDKLPNAYIGKPYYQDINIIGGAVIGHQLDLNTDFPNDMGITFNHIKDDKNDIYINNHLIIYGTPKYKGNYKVKIFATFYGGKGKSLEKTYDLIVQ